LRYQAIAGCVGDDWAHGFRQWEQALDLPDPEAVLAKHTAQRIEEAERSRGKVPAGLAREAKRILHPTVDPVRQLESKVRFAVSATFG